MPSQDALTRLREIRRKISARTHVDMDVPGYDNYLVARFGPLPWDVVEKSLKESAQRGGSDVAPPIAADGLAHAIQGFFTREPEGLQPLEFPEGTPVLRFDEALVGALALEHAESAREIIYELYLTGEAALIYQYNMLMDWTVERDYATDEETKREASRDSEIAPLSVSQPEPALSE